MPLNFSKLFPGFQISSRFFKVCTFGSIFTLGHVQNPPSFKMHPSQNLPDQNQLEAKSTRSKFNWFKIRQSQNPPKSKSTRLKSNQFKIHTIEIQPDQYQPESKPTIVKSTCLIQPKSKQGQNCTRTFARVDFLALSHFSK